MTTNLYLVRHGEVHNPKQVLYGRMPRFKLSKKGEQEIQKTASFLKNKSIKAIYSSPLLRARQTAGIIQKKLNLPKINITKALHEVKTSVEGKPTSFLDSFNHDYYSAPLWKEEYETMEQIAKRMEKVVNKIFKKHKGSSVVAVSHGDPILILKAFLNKVPLKITSIRKENFDIFHGHILRIQQVDNQPLTIESVFIPNI